MLTRATQAFAALLLAIAAGCAGTAPRPQTLDEVLAAQGFAPNEIVVPHAISDEMRAFVDQTVPAAMGAKQKVERLLAKLLDPSGKHLVYAPGYSGTAAEVFASGKANCLGFTHLFIGMARHAGVQVMFLRVNDVETYGRDGDLVVVAGHMIVGYRDDDGNMRVLDFSLQPIREYRLLEPLSDQAAVALYYANRGAEELRGGNDTEALRLLRLAVRIDPELPDGWVNLGVALRRSGDASGAEAAYRRTLELDADNSSAYQNLAALMRLRGDQDAAVKLLRLANDLQTRNPYTFLALGDWSLSAGRLEEAREFYRGAYRRGRSKVDTVAAMGLYELRVGNRAKAIEWLRKAKALDPQNERVEALELGLSVHAPIRG